MHCTIWFRICTTLKNRTVLGRWILTNGKLKSNAPGDPEILEGYIGSIALEYDASPSKLKCSTVRWLYNVQIIQN